MAEITERIAAIAPATKGYAGDIIVEIDRMEEGCVLLFQSEDGYNDFVGIEAPKIDELIAALQRAKEMLLPAGHGAQGEPATVRDLAHETPGRQSIYPMLFVRNASGGRFEISQAGSNDLFFTDRYGALALAKSIVSLVHFGEAGS